MVEENKKNKSKSAKEKAEKQLQLAHDSFFKQVMENQKVAKDLLSCHLPQNILADLDLQSLEMQKGSFVEESLQQQLTDVLFKCKTKEGDFGFVFLLLEHQSSCDHLMAFRMLRYKINILAKWIKENPNSKKLPMVHSLVLYNGQAKYIAATDIAELFANPASAQETLTKYKLVDLAKISDNELATHKTVGVVEYFMKHAFVRDVLKVLQKSEAFFLDLETNDPELVYILLKTILWYNLPKIREENKDEIREILQKLLKNKQQTEEFMGLAEKWFEGSLAQKWMNQGIEKGIEKGAHQNKLQIAKNMLAKGYNLQDVVSITGLNEAEIKKLS